MHTNQDLSAAGLMQQAADHIQNKRYAKAIECYEQALFAEPNNEKVLNVYVTFLFNLGQYRGALDTLVLSMTHYGMSIEKQNLYKNLANEVPAEARQHLGLKPLTGQDQLQLYRAFDLAGYCLSHGIDTHVMAEAKQHLLSPTNDYPPSYEQSRLGLHKTPEVKWAIIPNYITSRNSFTAFVGDCAIREEFTSQALDFFKLPEVDDLLHYVPSNSSLNTHVCGFALPEANLVPGLSINLINTYDHNYYHWLTELIPTLAACEQVNEKVTVIVREGLHEQFYQVLQTVLPANAELAYLSPKYPVTQARALVTMGMYYTPRKIHERMSNHIKDTYQSAFAIDWLVNKVVNATRSFEQSSSEWVYLARKGDTGLRRNLSEQAVTERLQQLGFDIYYCEDLSFHQQVALFQSAKLIVGPAGSAFANMAFCAPSCEVIMLTLEEGNDAGYHFFHKIANIVGCTLSYFKTPHTKADNIANSTRIFCTHRFDVDALATYLQQGVLTRFQ